MKIMKTLLVVALALTFSLGNIGTVQAGKKSNMKVAYVLRNVGVKRDVQAKLKPILVSYMADKKAAGKAYDDLKDKLKPSIEAGTITEKQAQQLLNLKWEADEKELAVKRQYETKFKTVLSTKKTYLVFSLLNDSKDKMLSKDNDD